MANLGLGASAVMGLRAGFESRGTETTGFGVTETTGLTVGAALGPTDIDGLITGQALAGMATPVGFVTSLANSGLMVAPAMVVAGAAGWALPQLTQNPCP